MPPRKLIAPRKHHQLITGGTVNFVIGKEKRSFIVHETLIRNSSPYYNEVLTRDWEDATERRILFPDDDPEIFELYLHWLYFGQFPLEEEECDDNNTLNKEDSHEVDSQANDEENIKSLTKNDYPTLGDQNMLLAKAYVLGGEIFCHKFQNAAIDAIIEGSKKGVIPGHDAVRYMYHHTAASDKIRQLFIDLYVEYGRGCWFTEVYEEFMSKYFLVDLTSALLTLKRRQRGLVNAKKYYTTTE
ncbi:hypothetical protein BJX99DRAFT_269737 [Aspergillus californicus]